MPDKPAHLFLIVLLVSSAVSCSGDAGDPGGREPPPVSVSSYTLRAEKVQASLEGFGNLSFRQKADITSAINGRIREIRHDEGDRVTEGTVLAEVFNIQYRIAAMQAEAALESAKASLNLAETRYREGRLQVERRLIELEKIALDLRQKEAELEYQRRQLQNKKRLNELGGVTEAEICSMQLSCSALEAETNSIEKDLEIGKIGFRDRDITEYGHSPPSDPERRKEILIELNSSTLKSEMEAAEARVKSAETDFMSAEALIRGDADKSADRRNSRSKIRRKGRADPDRREDVHGIRLIRDRFRLPGTGRDRRLSVNRTEDRTDNRRRGRPGLHTPESGL